MEALTRKIGSAAKTAIEESGTNMLHLTLGFLEWYESEDSRQPRLAPLLTVPVALERGRAKAKAFECTIEFSGEDLATNLSLVEKMRRDFGIEIPTIEEDDSPAQYFQRFETILAQKTGWKIRRHITLSLLSFGKLLMYRDLDKKVWPGVTKHELVKELFEGRKSETISHAEEYSIDAPELTHDLPPLIVDADSSQHSALIDAMRGRNLVIEGPPGTGKSQTITNLIASAVGSGKTVLFVSEKLAALEVVRRRLDEAGLGLFCLEFHSHKTRKDALLNDLALRLKAQGSFRDPRDLDKQLSLADAKKRLLTNHAALINKQVQPSQSTVFEILWARDRAYQELPFDAGMVETISLPAVLQFAPMHVAQAEQFLSIYSQHLEGVFRVCDSLDNHPWAWVNRPLHFEEQERLCDLLVLFDGNVQKAQLIHRELTEKTGISPELTISGLVAIATLLAAMPEVAEPLDHNLLKSCRDRAVRAMLVAFCKDIDDACSTRESVSKATTTSNPRLLLQHGVNRLEGATAQLRAYGSHCSPKRKVLTEHEDDGLDVHRLDMSTSARREHLLAGVCVVSGGMRHGVLRNWRLRLD